MMKINGSRVRGGAAFELQAFKALLYILGRKFPFILSRVIQAFLFKWPKSRLRIF